MVSMEAFDHQKKGFSITNFTKANPRFCFSLYYDADNSYLLVNGKKNFKFKNDNENVDFSNSVLSWKYI